MENLNAEEKSVSITFLTTPTMDRELKMLMEEKSWKKSAFIRVAIQKELDRIKNEEGNGND